MQTDAVLLGRAHKRVRGRVPHEWHDSPKFMQEWLQRRFGTEEKRKLYAPVEEELVITDYDLPEYQ